MLVIASFLFFRGCMAESRLEEKASYTEHLTLKTRLSSPQNLYFIGKKKGRKNIFSCKTRKKKFTFSILIQEIHPNFNPGLKTCTFPVQAHKKICRLEASFLRKEHKEDNSRNLQVKLYLGLWKSFSLIFVEDGL